MSAGDHLSPGEFPRRPREGKDDVAYRRATTSQCCGNCAMYHQHACDLVRGVIEPDAVCDRWESKA